MSVLDGLEIFHAALARAGCRPIQLDPAGWRAECPVSHDACMVFGAGGTLEPVRMKCRAKRPACTLGLVCAALGLTSVDERRVTGVPRPEPLRRPVRGE